MSKKITMTARPKPKPEIDKWVETRKPNVEPEPRIKPKRLTIDIDPKLHTELKISCAKRGIQIADLLRKLIEDDVQTYESNSYTG
ncbi:plasmid partition protein ParG [Rhodopirellula europaea]|uniref:Uncharacterized protein n=1 Tax=Rhodopirellula europaea SH398 TaxID=1263868 RepID=M5S0M0_9BACT|nr:plasmid partition protein ParG [Rhodopirellula europaea]EMI25100.1 hypothetical protein RESH_04325 [Rhodopirellula europaea SH398]